MRSLLATMCLSITAVGAQASELNEVLTLSSEICLKAYKCNQGAVDEAIKENPQMKAMIEQMMASMEQQCKNISSSNKLPANVEAYQQDKKLINLSVKCLKKQRDANCDYFTGEADYLKFEECRELEAYSGKFEQSLKQ